MACTYTNFTATLINPGTPVAGVRIVCNLPPLPCFQIGPFTRLHTTADMFGQHYIANDDPAISVFRVQYVTDVSIVLAYPSYLFVLPATIGQTLTITMSNLPVQYGLDPSTIFVVGINAAGQSFFPPTYGAPGCPDDLPPGVCGGGAGCPGTL